MITSKTCKDVQFFAKDGVEIEPLISISECQLVDDDTGTAINSFLQVGPLELSAKMANANSLKAFCIFAMTGNDLYLRFPKKLRRKRGWR